MEPFGLFHLLSALLPSAGKNTSPEGGAEQNVSPATGEEEEKTPPTAVREGEQANAYLQFFEAHEKRAKRR